MNNKTLKLIKNKIDKSKVIKSICYPTEKELYNLILNTYLLKLKDTQSIPRFYILKIKDLVSSICYQLQDRLNKNIYDFNFNELVKYIGQSVGTTPPTTKELLKPPQKYFYNDTTTIYNISLQSIIKDFTTLTFYKKATTETIDKLKENIKKYQLNYFAILNYYI